MPLAVVGAMGGARPVPSLNLYFPGLVTEFRSKNENQDPIEGRTPKCKPTPKQGGPHVGRGVVRNLVDNESFVVMKAH